MKKVLCLILCSGFLVSCISSQRLSRAMPWGDGSPGRITPDRTNLWPALYHAGDMTSVLWPLVDVDDKGFAVRPLLVRDGTEWSLLFPVSGWDTTTKEGWLGTGYKTRHNVGVVPLFNRNDEGDFNYIGPVWWLDEGRGVFPLAGKMDDVVHVGPVWWGTGTETEFGLFPLLYAEPGKEFWAFPLYSFNNRREQHAHKLVLGLLAGKDKDSSWLTPIWFAHRSGGASTRMLLPVFFYRADSTAKYLVTPLGGRGWSADGQTRMVNVLGPVFHSFNNGKGERYVNVLWPFYMQKDGPGERSSRLLLPVMWTFGDADSRYVITPLGGVGRDDATNEKLVNVLGPVFIHHTRGDTSRYVSVLWPLYRSSTNGACSSNSLFGIYDCTKSANLRRFETLLWLYARERVLADQGVLQRTRTRLFPLFSVAHTPDSDEFRLLFGALSQYKRDGDKSSFSCLKYAYHRERNGDQVQRDIFPFIKWDSGPDSAHRAFLWHTLDYQRNGAKRGGHVLFIPWGETE